METPVHNVELIAAVKLPDGKYYGMWCGNRVQFSTHLGEFQSNTGDLYVKGNCPCVVTVASGAITVRETCK